MVEEVRYLTVAQAAARLQTSDEMVRRMLRDGRLAGKRLGGKRAGWRVASDEIERLLAPDPRPRPGPRPARSAIDDRSTDLPLTQIRQNARTCRASGDLAGAARWDRAAARVMAELQARAD